LRELELRDGFLEKLLLAEGSRQEVLDEAGHPARQSRAQGHLPLFLRQEPKGKDPLFQGLKEPLSLLFPGHEDEVELALHFLQGLCGRGLDLHAGSFQVLELGLEDLSGNAPVEKDPAGFLRRIKDLYGKPAARKEIGKRQGLRPRAEDGYLLAFLLRRRKSGLLSAFVEDARDKGLKPPDGKGPVPFPARATALAVARAQAAEDSGNGAFLKGALVGLDGPSGPHQGHQGVGSQARGTGLAARGKGPLFDDRLLGHGLGKGNVDRAPRHQPFLELVRTPHGADLLALATTRALGRVHVGGLAPQGDPKSVFRPLHPADFGVDQGLHAGMVGGLGHLGGGDTACAVERGKDLAQEDHLPPDACLLFDQDHLKTHVRQRDGGLHAGDPAPDDQTMTTPLLTHGSIPSGLRRIFSCG